MAGASEDSRLPAGRKVVSHVGCSAGQRGLGIGGGGGWEVGVVWCGGWWCTAMLVRTVDVESKMGLRAGGGLRAATVDQWRLCFLR